MDLDQIVDDLIKIVNSASGSLKLEVAGEAALKVEINRNDKLEGSSEADYDRTVVKLDLLEPTYFSLSDDQTGIFDKLRTATEFPQKLTDIGNLQKG